MNRFDSSELRGFREPDMAPLRGLIHKTIFAAYTGIYPPLAIAYFIGYQSEEKIQERHRTGSVLVVERDGALIATGSVVGSYISSVFVHPDFHRNGYGRQVMGQLEEIAGKQSRDTVDLNISLPSRKFYEALGYTVLEEASIDLEKGERLNYWKAKKALFQPC
jgi:GNAT superfamily N-acetyltransferase